MLWKTFHYPQCTPNFNPVLKHFYRHAMYWLKKNRGRRKEKKKREKTKKTLRKKKLQCRLVALGTQLLLSGNQKIPYFYSNYYGGHPRIYRFRPLGSLQFSLEHCLGSTCHAIINFFFRPTPHIIYDLTLITWCSRQGF